MNLKPGTQKLISQWSNKKDFLNALLWSQAENAVNVRAEEKST